MKTLAIDTATEGCSVALWDNGELSTSVKVEPRMHADLILGMVEELLINADLKISQMDFVSFGRGPGAFTGVRIATGVIQGMAFGADLPVVPVSTLRALAQRSWSENQHPFVLSAFDARMEEVYWGAYQLDDNKLMQPVIEERVCHPQHVELPPGFTPDTWTGAGSGWQVYDEQLQSALGVTTLIRYPDLISRAEEILLLSLDDYQKGLAVSADKALPVYLRNKVAKKKGEK